MPAVEPRLTVRAIDPLVSGLHALGHDAEALLAAAGIDRALLSDPDVRVPTRAVIRLIDEAVARTGDVNLGLHLAERADLGASSVHFYAMLSSETLGAAYQRLCRYQRLVHDTDSIELEIQPERAVLRHRMPGSEPAPRHSAEFLVAAWVRAGRLVTGMDWSPLEVRFAHQAPADSRDLVRFFRSAVRFAAGENCVVMPRSLLDERCVRADEALIAVLERFAHDRLDDVSESDDVVDRVRSTLADELKGGEPTATQLARRLKMTVRTLNQSLSAVGTSYKEVLDALRRELALRYLASNQLSISEIAFFLGFANLRSFHHAFKRWTGDAPEDFRQRAHSTA